MKFERKTFWSWSKFCFLKSVEFFRKEFFFVFENSYQYCRNLNKNLRIFHTKKSPVCQVSLLHLKPFSWRIKDVSNCIKVCFSNFKQNCITNFEQKTCGNVLEIHCTSTLEKFEHVFSNKNYKFFCKNFHSLEVWNKSFRAVGTKFSAVWQNCTKRVHGKI